MPLESPADLRAPADAHAQMLSALERVALALNGAGVRWAVGASMMLYLRGVTQTFGDIDIVLHPDDALSAHACLREVCTCVDAQQCAAPEKARVFSSNPFHRYVCGAAQIETMAGLHVRHHSGCYAYAFARGHAHVLVGAQRVALCPLEDWYVLYQLMPRREHRLREIEAYWKSAKPNARRLSMLVRTGVPARVRVRTRRFCACAGRARFTPVRRRECVR